MDKRNVHTTTGDSLHMVKDYDQKIQYRTFRAVVSPSDLPKKVRESYQIDRDTAIVATVRFDDHCGNGHCTFTTTGNVLETDARGARRDPVRAGGCIHDLLAVAFPELAPAIKWHLTSTDGPMHYPGNVTYLAGDADCYGRRQGDVSRWEYGVRFGNSPVTHTTRSKFWHFLKERYSPTSLDSFVVVAINHVNTPGDNYRFKPKYTFAGFADKWHDCPFDSQAEANEFAGAMNSAIGVEFAQIPVEYSEGKARELDHARSCAVWPEASDAELSVPKAELEAVLMARLPAMMAEFRATVESLGFDYEFPAKVR